MTEWVNQRAIYWLPNNTEHRQVRYIAAFNKSVGGDLLYWCKLTLPYGQDHMVIEPGSVPSLPAGMFRANFPAIGNSPVWLALYSDDPSENEDAVQVGDRVNTVQEDWVLEAE